MAHLAFVYPGQGSQKVGMGQDWAAAFPTARQTFEEADDALGMHLSRLAFEGPDEDLQLTANTQPAILACSIAIHRVVLEAGVESVAMAGHSLGEYSALVASEALDFGDALRLVRRRGELMQEAVPVGVGAMAAVMGLEADAVRSLAEDATDEGAKGGAEVCAVANYNSPLQTVISGHRPAVERAVALAKEHGAKRAKLLPVSAPFHSPLMRPARDGLAPSLRDTRFSAPKVRVVTNIDALPAASGDAARDALERQIDGPVRWVETLGWLAREAEAECVVEVGPGNVLSGLGRRTEAEIDWVPLPKPQALDKLLAKI